MSHPRLESDREYSTSQRTHGWLEQRLAGQPAELVARINEHRTRDGLRALNVPNVSNMTTPAAPPSTPAPAVSVGAQIARVFFVACPGRAILSKKFRAGHVERILPTAFDLEHLNGPASEWHLRLAHGGLSFQANGLRLRATMDLRAGLVVEWRPNEKDGLHAAIVRRIMAGELRHISVGLKSLKSLTKETRLCDKIETVFSAELDHIAFVPAGKRGLYPGATAWAFTGPAGEDARIDQRKRAIESALRIARKP